MLGPLCGGTHLKRVMTCTDFYASGEQFDVMSCEDCGLLSRRMFL